MIYFDSASGQLMAYDSSEWIALIGWSSIIRAGAGDMSLTWGDQTTAAGSYASAGGYATHANASYLTALGRYNLGAYTFSDDGDASNDGDKQWRDLDPLLELGNGISAENRSNALTVLKNGLTTLENRYWTHADENSDGTPDSLSDPSFVPSDENGSAGQALIVNGHATFNGDVTIAHISPQGGISMGIFGE